MVYLTGDLHAVDWIEPDPYVTRIQSVGVIIPELRTGIRPLLHPEYVLKPVLDYPIHHANAPDTLFPNLRSVIFKDSWVAPQYARLLLTPHLRRLVLPTLSFSQDVGPMNPQQAPFRNLLPHIPNAVVRMGNLASIHINSTILLQDSVTAHLASLPTLTSIYVDGTAGCASFQPVQFPHLRNLLITCRDANPAAMLSLLDAPALEKVMVLCTWDAQDVKGMDEHISEWLDVLYRPPSTSELTRVPALEHFILLLEEGQKEMFARHKDVTIDSFLDNGPDTLHALIRFRLLRTVRIEFDIMIQLDNDFVCALAEGLPNIEELSLTPPPGTGHPQPRYSRHLRIDAFWYTYRQSTVGAQQRPSPLKTLLLWTTPMIGGANARTVSVFLGWIFPELVSLRPYVQAVVGRVFNREMRHVSRAEWTAVLSEMRLGGEIPP
ncbi:hypothetical protein BD310DRAFT_1035651 [Dichomitus squalens]|uniref:F-box domain-containing protein n=1 Tax=Dichomitus squalens TaxID=114155 RepID=A0A4V2K9D1_9APHY|nr:hypothetical protein BD310DRAFT_1035651 [Dichomitus squalens]